MNSEFENRLQSQPLREIPPHWRSRILAAAEQPAQASWRDWFWPAPRAWAALGMAWIVIFLLRLSTPAGPSSSGYSAPSMATLQQEAVMMAQLLGPSDSAERPPTLPAEPKPRTDRERKQWVG